MTLRRLTVLAAIMLVALGPTTLSHSMILVLGGPDGTDDEPDVDCDEGEECTSTEGWNPTIYCPTADGDDINDLLECLEDEIANPPPPCPPSVAQPGSSIGDDDPNHPVDIMQNPPSSEDCDEPQHRWDFDVSSIYPRMLMGRHWFYYYPDEHLYYYDAATITRLLQDEGFRVLRVERATKPLTLEYTLANLSHFNRTLGRVASVLARPVPDFMRDRVLPIYLGEMQVVAARD